jgi:hypothetical protein
MGGNSVSELDDRIDAVIADARAVAKEAEAALRHADRCAAVLTAQAERWQALFDRRVSRASSITVLAVAALTVGPASTREVVDAVQVAAPVSAGSIGAALRRAEAAGDVTGIRMPGKWGVLWALRGVAVSA